MLQEKAQREKIFFCGQVSLMADGTAPDGASAFSSPQKATRGSLRLKAGDIYWPWYDFISCNTRTQMCSKHLFLKTRPNFSSSNASESLNQGKFDTGGLLWWAASFCRGFIFKYVITQNASGPTFIWGLGNFKFVIFTHFSTFNPAPLIASSAMQIQLLLPQYVIRGSSICRKVWFPIPPSGYVLPICNLI